MPPILKELIDLQEMDNEILDLEERLNEMPCQIETSRSFLEAEKDVVNTACQEIEELKKKRQLIFFLKIYLCNLDRVV